MSPLPTIRRISQSECKPAVRIKPWTRQSVSWKGKLFVSCHGLFVPASVISLHFDNRLANDNAWRYYQASERPPDDAQQNSRHLALAADLRTQLIQAP
jgi:hypothetical protein